MLFAGVLQKKIFPAAKNTEGKKNLNHLKILECRIQVLPYLIHQHPVFLSIWFQYYSEASAACVFLKFDQ